MAHDVLNILITIVASESAFDIGGLILTKYKNSIFPENLQILICTRNWLYGFVTNRDCNIFCIFAVYTLQYLFISLSLELIV